MADSENIDRFNKVASEAFSILYSFFPQPCNFDPSDFDIPKDENGCVQQTDAAFVAATVWWLEDEGYVRIGGKGMDGTVHAAVLTGKGLAVLRLIPDSLKNDAPLGEQIQTAVKSGAGKVAMKLVDKVLDAGIRYTMAHAGVPI
ncbi:hypothetical protein AWB69_06249 [Caballeronia udeis]|uniref:Uncharacterized protein n=1 Tax=Caballeronia udeis TaxID=1232866 RepID=A0A158IM27_9BURK|nr:hypothetical protein [Caballeronia udeis]SAL57557.1 hypothetical protein AWB69_06249 [Caballeronia udeis]